MTEMPKQDDLSPAKAQEARPITIAVNAIGGQGGGVLAEWIVHLAGENGYIAQYTSVPGVAQRTGATVYYLELFPETALLANDGKYPVMGLMPASGDVDVVIASELMEAGRAMMRNFVTPERTTLITSSHRIYGILEKSDMGDGIGDAACVREAAKQQAKQFIDFDMDALAADTGSVISSVLFGALAGSGVLPIAREAFEETIRHGKRAVATNLAGFSAGFEGAQKALSGEREGPVVVEDPDETILRAKATTPTGKALIERILAEFPKPAHVTLYEGVKRCADYLDVRYAHEYLDTMAELAALDSHDAKHFTAECARYLAVWMTYEDTIRVADLKTRSKRFARVREEVRAGDGQLLYMTEFMHPRYVEVCEALPWWIGGPLYKMTWLEKLTNPLFSKGRFIKTAKLRGFLLLNAVAAMRPIKRVTLRHKNEMAAIEAWLKTAKAHVASNYELAVEIIRTQRLIKGYSDTHQRGMKNFRTVMNLVNERPDMTGDQVMALSAAALADEQGKALAAAIEQLDERGAG
jgi:indolepyruvate ferredoxin oxidoreductase beta subunit